MSRSTLTTALLATTALLGACAGADEPLSFEEFQAQAYQEPDTGIWIINGDEPAVTLDDLTAQYQRYLGSEAAADGLGVTREGLIVNQVGGQDDRWDAATAANLTYCIATGKGGFSAAQYAATVAAMDTATAAWEASANLNFVHASSLDSKCSSRAAVVFNVRPVTTTQYLARAFFPSTARRGREILVSTSSFGAIDPWTLPGILRHELGHTIGMRHEHTRPETGTCFEDTSWRALTAYDSASVMHYPQCNGSQTGDLVLTALDQAGAAALYP